MPNVVLMPEKSTRVPALDDYISGWMSTSYKLRSHIGSEPLEDGSSVHDHAVASSTGLVLRGFVSDLSQLGPSAPAAAWQKLEEYHRDSTALQVITPWASYAEMIIQRCEARERGFSMDFALELMKIIRVSVEQGAVSSETSSGPAIGRSSEVQRGRVLPPDWY